MDALQFSSDIFVNSEVFHAVVPTVVLPFAVIGFILATIATFIAGLFGIQLKAEGPRRLIELILRPKVLFSALLINLLIWGCVKLYSYWHTLPDPMIYISWKNDSNPPLENKLANKGSDAQSPSDKNLLSNKVDPYSDSLPVNRFSWGQESYTIKSVTPKWERAMPSGSFTGPVLVDLQDGMQNLYVSTDSGVIYELDAATGENSRSFFIGTYLIPKPTFVGDMLYVGEGVHTTYKARLYGFSLKSGKLEKNFQTKGHVEGRSVHYKSKESDLIIFPAGKDGLYALHRESFELAWHFTLSHTDAQVSIEGDTIYTAFSVEKGEEYKGQYAVALKAETGEVLWKRALSSSGWNAPITFENRVCYGLGEIYLRREYGQFACFDKVNGLPMDSYDLDGPVVGRPILVNQMAVVADVYSNVYGIDLAAEKKIWQVSGDEKKRIRFPAPVYDNHGHIIIATEINHLAFYGLLDGKLKFQWKREQGAENIPSALPVHDGENSIYMTDWRARPKEGATYIMKLEVEYQHNQKLSLQKE